MVHSRHEPPHGSLVALQLSARLPNPASVPSEDAAERIAAIERVSIRPGARQDFTVVAGEEKLRSGRTSLGPWVPDAHEVVGTRRSALPAIVSIPCARVDEAEVTC